MQRSNGSKKWDVDGREYIDYWMGHGSLILGHGHPSIVKAVQEQASQGMHFGASHELEVRWAELIRDMVPCADLVRFCASGTEATLLALRLARAFTGRSKVIRLHDHFHGWHDYAMCGFRAPYENASSPGIPDEVCNSMLSFSDQAAEAIEQELNTGEVAAVIVEPTGPSFGTVPLHTDFLETLRSITAATGTLLIFDEVISGFRLAPGGAQERFNILPDMSTLAKAVSGGLPGAAVVGRQDVLSLLSPTGSGGKKVPHPGTSNGNPMSAAAGIAALEELQSGQPQAQAEKTNTKLKVGTNKILRELGVEGAAYGIASLFHLHIGTGLEAELDGTVLSFDRTTLVKDCKAHPLNIRFRRALLEQGVDFMRSGGMVSSVHTDDDVAVTLEAIETALQDLKRNPSTA